MTISKDNAPFHTWGDKCGAWTLVQSESTLVKEERMPPATSERLHYHVKTEQFFYILEGRASFFLEDREILLLQGDGIKVPLGQPHKIVNRSLEELRFLVVSFHWEEGDRVDM